MARARFSAIMTLPIDAKGLVKSEKRGRGSARIRGTKRLTTVRIEAADMPSLKATVNSVLRNLTVVESVSESAKNRKNRT